MLELLRYLIVLIGTALATVTDVKSGLILDKITYPMIALGIFFTGLDLFFTKNFLQLFIPVGVFSLGYALYYLGKLGGGDVKIFTAMSLLLPYFKGEPFILNVLLIAALSSVTVISLYFLIKYFRKGINVKENRKEMLKSFLLGLALLLYFLLLHQFGLLELTHVLILFFPLSLALLFLAFQKGIKRNFFLKFVSPSELEEDEIIAKEFLKKDLLQGSGLSIKGILEKENAQRLTALGIEKIPVYRSLPPFAPFLLLGVIISFFYPGLFSELFLPL